MFTGIVVVVVVSGVVVVVVSGVVVVVVSGVVTDTSGPCVLNKKIENEPKINRNIKESINLLFIIREDLYCET